MNYSVIQPMDCPDNKPTQIINAADFRSLDDPTSNTKEFPCWGNDTVSCDKLRYARVHKSQAPGRRGHHMLCGDAWYLCTLSKKLTSCFLFLACWILRLFLDFWKVCAPQALTSCSLAGRVITPYGLEGTSTAAFTLQDTTGRLHTSVTLSVSTLSLLV
jgi:hypothetical protein